MRRLYLASICILSLAATSDDAGACACCSNTGQRHVGRAAMDSGKRQEIGSLRFGAQATLFLGKRDTDQITGIVTPDSSYDLTVTSHDDRLVFAFRDHIGHTGTLVLTLPNTIAIFEVDPRDKPDNGLGPRLYKEWTLTARAAGTGIFKPGIKRRQTLALILHGGGNSCTSSVDFSHWTLEMRGPRATYRLIGDLLSPG